MTGTYWFCAVVTIISALTSLGFSIAAIRIPKSGISTNAMYATSRSLALVVLAVVPFFYESRIWLIEIALAMIIVQALDAVIGNIKHDMQKTAGPAFLAILNLFALILFIR
jgi:hypothetical protein